MISACIHTIDANESSYGRFYHATIVDPRKLPCPQWQQHQHQHCWLASTSALDASLSCTLMPGETRFTNHDDDGDDDDDDDDDDDG